MITDEDKKAAENYSESHAVRTDGGGWEETYDHKEQEAAFLAGVEHAWRWIPVSKRLPSKGELVLVVSEGRMSFGHRLGAHWEVSREGYEWLDVSHWMPLPKLPEEEK